MTSPPPAPSMTSLPVPVVRILADVEPVTVSAVPSALASRFSKFATSTLSPAVWSAPAATEKLTAVTAAPAPTNNVSLPTPPSIDVSAPR